MAHAPPSSLLRLPTELVDKVFGQAYEDQEDRRLARRPVCRRLAPIQRAHLYGDVELQTYESLALFCRTLRTVEGTGKLVVGLSLDLENERNALPPDDSDDEDEDHDSRSMTSQEARDGRTGHQVVAPADLEVIIPSLTALRTLQVRRLAIPLLKVLLLNEAASMSLVSLKRLEIDDGSNSGSSFRDAWQSLALVESLARLPRLEDLTIRQSGQGVKILPEVGASASFPHLTRLSLQGCHAPDWLVASSPHLDRVAPRLVELHLADMDTRPWIMPALQRAPIELRKISLSCCVRPSALNTVLPRFEHLEQFELRNGTFDTWSRMAFDDILPHKLFHTLAFIGAVTTDANLLDLLDSSPRLPSLARVVVDRMWPCRGSTVKAMGGSSRRERYAHWPMWPGWERPKYPPGCSEEGLRAVIQAAQRRNVVVDGNALEALGWTEAFEAERRAAHLALGDEMGDYELARKVLGNAVVDAHLGER
ncbi:hypothetical protein JCM9279_002672 [Rhodotorula babjevae]